MSDHFELKEVVKPSLLFPRPIQGPPTPPTPLLTKWCLQAGEERQGKEAKLGEEATRSKADRRPEGSAGRQGKKLARQEKGGFTNTGSLGKENATREKEKVVFGSEKHKTIETSDSRQGRHGVKKVGGSKILSQQLKKVAEMTPTLKKEPRKGKAIESVSISNPISIKLPQQKKLSRRPPKAEQATNVRDKSDRRESLLTRTNNLPESRKSSKSMKKSKQSLSTLARPQPSPATLQARDFSSPSKSTPSPSSPSSSSSSSSKQKEGNIGHWIPAPSLAPFVPPSLLPVGSKSRSQQKSSRRGKGRRKEEDESQKINRNKSKNEDFSKKSLPQQSERFGKLRKPEKEMKASKLSKSNLSNVRKAGRHSYLPEPGDSLRSSANVPLLPPKKLSRLQVEEFSVIMPPKGGRKVGTVMRPPPSAIGPAAEAPTKAATLGENPSAKAPIKASDLAALLPPPAKAPIKTSILPPPTKAILPPLAKVPTKSSADLPASITVLSPPISVDTNLPNLPAINGTFSEEQPVVRIALPQAKKLKAVSSLAGSTEVKEELEEGVPEPDPSAPHGESGESEEEATPEPSPKREREPKAVQTKGRHKGGDLPSPPTPIAKLRGGSPPGARTGKGVLGKSGKDKEIPVRKAENVKGRESSQGGRRTGGGGRKRKGRRNQGGRKRKKQDRKTLKGRKKEAENVLKVDDKKNLKQGEDAVKNMRDVKDPDVNLGREEVRINVSMKKMKNKVKLKSKHPSWSQSNKGGGTDLRGDDGSLDLPEIPIFSSGPGRKGRKYEVGLRGKELDDEEEEDKEEEEEELPFYSLPRFSSLASLSRPPPQALLGLAGLAP